MLELKSVTKKYLDSQDDAPALEKVNLTMPDTGLVIIHGTSGCGKTTLLNILGGLDCPTDGEVYYRGKRIDNESEQWWDSFRASKLGFIYQDFNLLENITVKDNIKLPLSLLGEKEEIKDAKVQEIANELGLEEYINKKAGKLSGGQKQRVAIARAIISGAEIILADEPTGNLDKENSENVFKVLKNIAANRLVVVVTHDGELAKKYADRLIKIAYGHIEKIDVVNESNELVNLSETDSKLPKRRLALKESFGFAWSAIKQRELRCFVSIVIFSITMLFILIVSGVIFRNDSGSISKHLLDYDHKILPIYTDIAKGYGSLSEGEHVASGKKLYELLIECCDESRIVRSGGICDIIVSEKDVFWGSVIFVNSNNEKYFTYEGKFPQKANEVAVSNVYFEILGDDILNSKIQIGDDEYVITAIISKIGNTDIKDFCIDDGNSFKQFENLVVFNETAILNNESYLYVSGFDIGRQSDLFYHTTIYNDVGVVSGDITLVKGCMPQNKSEILISESKSKTTEILFPDYLDKKYSLLDLDDSKYGRTYWNKLNLFDYMNGNITVVGITENSECDYYITSELYDEIFEEYYTYYNLNYYYLVDEDTLHKDVHNFIKNDIKFDDYNMYKVYDLIHNVASVKIAMIIVVLVLSVLTVLQMISLYSYSISDNKKIIGILRTLGVDKKDTNRIFVVECLLVSIVAFIIANIANIFVATALNNFVNNFILDLVGYEFVSIRFVVIFIAGAVNVLLSILSVLIPLRKFSRVKIIELIK